jgi:hypothetical protein
MRRRLLAVFTGLLLALLQGACGSSPHYTHFSRIYQDPAGHQYARVYYEQVKLSWWEYLPNEGWAIYVGPPELPEEATPTSRVVGLKDSGEPTDTRKDAAAVPARQIISKQTTQQEAWISYRSPAQ